MYPGNHWNNQDIEHNHPPTFLIEQKIIRSRHLLSATSPATTCPGINRPCREGIWSHWEQASCWQDLFSPLSLIVVPQFTKKLGHWRTIHRDLKCLLTRGDAHPLHDCYQSSKYVAPLRMASWLEVAVGRNLLRRSYPHQEEIMMWLAWVKDDSPHYSPLCPWKGVKKKLEASLAHTKELRGKYRGRNCGAQWPSELMPE